MAEDLTSTDEVATILTLENGASRPGRLKEACGNLKDATFDILAPALPLRKDDIPALFMKPDTLPESSMTVEATTSNDDLRMAAAPLFKEFRRLLC
mmetsp:Transcript_40516/g.127606  ORF Transcript_40516/g.127606 Transcript_40516/m.127606 type:complete len:96 (-) Transcript_40516:6-293(-)